MSPEYLPDDKSHPGAPLRHTAEQPQQACESRLDHLVRVASHLWPPRLRPTQQPTEKPWLRGHCERCGSMLIVEDPPAGSITVRLYHDETGARVGRVEAVGTVEPPDAPRQPQVEAETAPARRKG